MLRNQMKTGLLLVSLDRQLHMSKCTGHIFASFYVFQLIVIRALRFRYMRTYIRCAAHSEGERIVTLVGVSATYQSFRLILSA